MKCKSSGKHPKSKISDRYVNRKFNIYADFLRYKEYLKDKAKEKADPEVSAVKKSCLRLF